MSHHCNYYQRYMKESHSYFGTGSVCAGRRMIWNWSFGRNINYFYYIWNCVETTSRRVDLIYEFLLHGLGRNLRIRVIYKVTALQFQDDKIDCSMWLLVNLKDNGSDIRITCMLQHKTKARLFLFSTMLHSKRNGSENYRKFCLRQTMWFVNSFICGRKLWYEVESARP